MDSSADPMRAVQDALENLYNVLHTADMHRNGGLRCDDPRAFRRTWKQFDEALRASAEVMQKPKLGQGLSAFWLRLICQAAAKVEDAARQYEGGWGDWRLNHNDSLFGLVTNDRMTGYQIAKFRASGKRGLASPLQPEFRPIERLRQIADDWTADFQDAPNEPPTMTLHEEQVGWIHWRQKRDAYVRTAGELVLRAIDAVEIAAEWFENSEFRERVLKQVDMPAGLLWPYLREISGKGYESGWTGLNPVGPTRPPGRRRAHHRETTPHQICTRATSGFMKISSLTTVSRCQSS